MVGTWMQSCLILCCISLACSASCHRCSPPFWCLSIRWLTFWGLRKFCVALAVSYLVAGWRVIQWVCRHLLEHEQMFPSSSEFILQLPSAISSYIINEDKLVNTCSSHICQSHKILNYNVTAPRNGATITKMKFLLA